MNFESIHCPTFALSGHVGNSLTIEVNSFLARVETIRRLPLGEAGNLWFNASKLDLNPIISALVKLIGIVPPPPELADGAGLVLAAGEALPDGDADALPEGEDEAEDDGDGEEEGEAAAH